MGEMIKMVVVLTVLSVISGGGLSWLKGFTEPKIENQVMNLVKGPAIRQILKDAENDPVEDRFKIKDGEEERNVFVGVFGGTADTVVMEASASGFADKVGLVVAINMADETLRGIAVTTHKETPGLGAMAKDDPKFSAQFAGKPIGTPLKVTNDGGSVNALSGATITSRAVCAGVNNAITSYNKLKPQLEEQIKGMGK
ncbi:RnfABCDGE type electron transport complex subunit G [Desulfosarcina ovata]|uniref:Ion-translocating oxidoreductase complex subunit G n=2 Tax=Desulfosarcina ovata TaxID=83564 RepID=A0A5K8AJ65_9BACT|nr:RnfABCDGE type electron transport complex subunit G [Desulfosarcina ovata]BBO85514.1 electron transport complex subunit G [Desulfosarcina ovata subsp. sediminis]BBO92549.1 electron transport complex subunit G [Desulfosarcina ovata subsp. ovata]